MDLEREARRRGDRLRILVTRLRYLGDVIMSTPVLRALKKRYPHSELFYLTECPYAEILEGHEDLDGIISLGREPMEQLRAIATLRKLKCTAAVDLLYNPRSAWLLFLSGIPIRVGGARRWRKRLYTETVAVPKELKSAIAHHLYALHVFDAQHSNGLPKVYLTTRERQAGASLLDRTVGERDEGRPIIALHPGGTWSSKRWMPESFAALAEILSREWGAKLLVIAGPGEEGIARTVVTKTRRAAWMLPVQPIRSLAAVLAHCDALIANDGGVLHLAVALDRPTVGIFGPTEPDIWFPYEGKGPFALASRNESCAPCHLHYCDDMRCLKQLDPSLVLSKVKEVMRWG